MADETILVVDADQETDQKITSALEAEGYLVFSGVSHVVTDEMAGKLNPSLIYIKPLSPNAAGFQPCREIHAIPKLQKVPIVLLAALKGKVQPQYTEYYGIVDFLKPNFTDEELIAKTVSVLASAQPPAEPEEEVSRPIEVEESASFEEPLAVEEPMVLSKPPAEEKPAAAEDLITRNEPTAPEKPSVWNEPTAADEPLSMNKPPAESKTPQKKAPEPTRAKEEEFAWEDETPKPAPSKQPMPNRTYRQRKAQKPSLLPWLLGLLILVALGGGGFFAYQYFMPAQKPVVREVKKAAPPAAPEQKEAASAPTAPPVAQAPATAPAVPAPVATTPAQTPAAVPAPAAPVKAPEPAPVAAAKAPAPAVSQPAPPSKKPTYAVQVGAFKTEDIAAVLVKKLKGKGYEAYAQKGVTKDKAPIIRVLIGNFADRKAAMKLASEVQSKEQIKTTIFTD